MSDSILAQKYATDGAVKLGQIVSADELEIIASEIEYYRNSTAKSVPQRYITYEADDVDQDKVVRNCYWMNLFSDFFSQLGEMLELPKRIAPLVGWTPILHNVETFLKPAVVGSTVPYHQDAAYLCVSPGDKIATVWLSIDHASEENGGVEFYLGSHLNGPVLHTLEESRIDNLVLDGNSILKEQKPTVFSLKPGEASLHHAYTFHGSPSNASDKARRGLAMAFRDVSTKVNEEHMRMMFGFSWLDIESQ